MAEADGVAEQSVAIEIAREHGNAAPAEAGEGASFPIRARLVVEVVLEEAPIGGDVGGFVGLAEEAVEGLPGRQAASGRELQSVERHMGAAEVDRRDPSGIGDEIGEHVAPSRSDRHDVALRRQRQCLQVDLGVLPDLRVDQAFECPGEHDFRAGLRSKRRDCGAPPGSGDGWPQLWMRTSSQAPCDRSNRQGLGTGADVSLMTAPWGAGTATLFPTSTVFSPSLKCLEREGSRSGSRGVGGEGADRHPQPSPEVGERSL
jgi:hypothetical protein